MPKPRPQFPTSLRWNADEARHVLALVDSSGLSVEDFAQRHGLERQRLERWRRKLGGQRGGAAKFVEVITQRAPIVVEVLLPSGATVRIPESVDADALRAILAAVEQATC